MLVPLLWVGGWLSACVCERHMYRFLLVVAIYACFILYGVPFFLAPSSHSNRLNMLMFGVCVRWCEVAKTERADVYTHTRRYDIGGCTIKGIFVR